MSDIKAYIASQAFYYHLIIYPLIAALCVLVYACAVQGAENIKAVNAAHQEDV